MRWRWAFAVFAAGVALSACASVKRRVAQPPTPALMYLSGGDAVLAKPGGGDPRVLGPARQALLAPDGRTVVALSSRAGRALLTAYTVHRRAVSSRIVAVLAPPDFATRGIRLLAWSSDSRLVALSGYSLSRSGEDGALLVANLASGQLTAIARGTLLGASFSPTQPDRIVYADATIIQLDDNQARLWIASADGTGRTALTHSGLASWPLWTKAGIYFARLERLGTAGSAPTYGVWRVQPDGSQPAPLSGISGGPPATALAASANGRRVVANLESRSGGSVAVWTAMLDRTGWSAQQLGLAGIATAVSRNGKLILTNVFGSEPEVEAVPWTGAPGRSLALGASAPGWNR